MSDRTRGLYNKFKGIERTDGQSAPGQKHHGCEYFVLDVTHDPFARSALSAYSRACRKEYPLLANDLTRKLLEMWHQGVFDPDYEPAPSAPLVLPDGCCPRPEHPLNGPGFQCAPAEKGGA